MLAAASVLFLSLAAPSYSHAATAARASAAPSSVVAAGTVTIRVDRAALIGFRVPVNVHLTGDCLSSDQPGTGLLGMLVPVAGTPGYPLHFGTLPPELGGRAYGLVCAANNGVLTAGRYNLYVAPLRRPGTLTLRLPGLAGRLTVHPVKAVHSTARLLPAAALSEPGVNYSWGASDRLYGTGLVYTALWMTSSASPSSLLGTCQYKGDPPPQVGYGPGCPAADYSDATPYSGHLQSTENYDFSTTSNLPAGTYGNGGYAAGANVSATGAALGWWLTF